MRWLEPHYYYFLSIAFAGLLLTCYGMYGKWRLDQDRPPINWNEMRKLPPAEAVKALNLAINGPPGRESMEAIGRVGTLIALFVGSFGLGLLLRHKNYTAKGMIRSAARRWRLGLGILIPFTFVIATYTYETNTFVIRGLIRGESFFDGRPTSYWKAQFKEEAQSSYGMLPRWMVEQFTSRGREALPVLTEAVRDEDKDVRWVAVDLFGRCGKVAAAELPLLVEALRDKEARVRFRAILAVVNVAPDATTALAAIQSLLDDADFNVVRQAVHCYCQLDPQAPRTKFNWQEFTSKEFGFQCIMPQEVTQGQRTLEAADDQAQIREFRAAFNDAIFAIAVVDYPEGSPRIATEEERINRGRDLLLENVQGEIMRDEPITCIGLSGREIIVRVPTRGVALRSRTFWKGNRMYHLLVSAAGREVLTKQADLFLDSFALLKPDKEK